VRVVLLELRISCWSWGSVLELVRFVGAMELIGELGTCGLSTELGLWLYVLLCRSGCTPLGSVAFATILSLIGGAVVEVPTMICCGGIPSALELGNALPSSSLRLKLEL
jgi:ABC-type tungstate transport system substrate-binding protein